MPNCLVPSPVPYILALHCFPASRSIFLRSHCIVDLFTLHWHHSAVTFHLASTITLRVPSFSFPPTLPFHLFAQFCFILRSLHHLHNFWCNCNSNIISIFICTIAFHIFHCLRSSNSCKLLIGQTKLSSFLSYCFFAITFVCLSVSQVGCFSLFCSSGRSGSGSGSITSPH